MNKTFTRSKTAKLTLLAILIALLIVLGLVNIPQPAGLSITFNMIPVAIAAMALGVKGGALIGGAFGLISFLQCFGIVGYSAMGAALVNISPILTFIQRFLTRLMVGVCVALVFRFQGKRVRIWLRCAITGFSAAFLNTLFFMLTLVLLFGNTEYMQNLIQGRTILVYIAASVGINAVVEMVVSALVSGAVGTALYKARMIGVE